MINTLVKNSYNQIARNYLAGRDQFKNTKYLEQLNRLLKPNSSILDVGCGAGVPIDRFFIDHGHEVTGIDISPEQIKLAQKNVPQATYQVKDMSELIDGEYTVDAVVSFYAIFHTPREEHLAILQRFFSFLSPSGLTLITMGAGEWEGKETDFFGGEMYWSHYGAEDNIKLVQDAGFSIISTEIDTSGNEKHLVILARKA